MEEEQEQPKKISLPEGIFMMEVVVLADVVEILVDLTGFGIIIGEIINFATGAMIEGWLLMKGLRGTRNLVSFGVGTILDGVTTSFLPVKSITMVITIYLVNHPKVLEKVGKAAAIAGAASALKGKVGGYQPSKEEIGKAEGMMSPEQKAMSATRAGEIEKAEGMMNPTQRQMSLKREEVANINEDIKRQMAPLNEKLGTMRAEQMMTEEQKQMSAAREKELAGNEVVPRRKPAQPNEENRDEDAYEHDKAA